MLMLHINSFKHSVCYSEIRQEVTESESIKARKTETQIAA